MGFLCPEITHYPRSKLLIKECVAPQPLLLLVLAPKGLGEDRDTSSSTGTSEVPGPFEFGGRVLGKKHRSRAEL